MPIPGEHHFEIYAGDTPQNKKWQLFQPDGVTPQNLAGATVVLQARRAIFDVEPIIDLTAVMNTPDQGAFHFEFPARLAFLVENQARTVLLYDMELRRNGEIKTLARGNLTIVKDITHD